jgi:tetratricopeptide (TPR) repeat protein
VRESLRRLSEDFADASVTWRTVSDVALARFQFDPAQKAARTSVQLAPGNQRNWFSLAAAYAGNGWFDEATRCLDEAKKLNRRSFATSREQSFGQWQVGRAVNHWAMTRTYVLLAGVVGFLYFGLLGVAVAMSAPMLLREIRVRQLPDNLRQLADTAWQAEHKLRILNAVAVLSVLAAWGLVFSIRG